MTDCYTYALCEICRKTSCEKRVKEYTGDMRHVPCDGICHICTMAIHHHSMIDVEPFTSMDNIQACVMYHLQKHHRIKFYGRQGENSDKSLVEQAVTQVLKCRICTFDGVIMPLIEELAFCKGCLNNQPEVCVQNFITRLKANKTCKNLQEVESEIILAISRNNGATLKEICGQIKIPNSFFVHEITISQIISDLIDQKKITKDENDKYHIRE